MKQQNVLEISGLDVSLPTGDRILSGVDLAIGGGRILGVIGESGAGKSMIGACIADTLPGALAVSAGSIEFDGLPLGSMTRATRRDLLGRDIGFIPQEPMTALNPALTIGQQFGGHLARIGFRWPKERKERTIQLLEDVHLPRSRELLSHYPHQLSGGMLQRVLIAMAFASNPKLVVADEPTTALDVTIQARVAELIARMVETHGASVLFITHDLCLAADLCDEVAVLYAGRIVESGAAETIIGSPAHPYSRCLSLATPTLSGPPRPLLTLPGTMPSALERSVTAGCELAPRCPVAEMRCHTDKPLLASTTTGHRSACHFPERVSAIQAPAEGPQAAAREPGPDVVLRAEGLAKIYIARDWIGRMRRVEALRGLDFEVREGEFVGVVGESGSGKSTLTKLILGLEDVTTGRLDVAGFAGSDRSAATLRALRDQVQLVFQDPQSALNPRRSIGSLVTQSLEARADRPSRAARSAIARDLLAKVLLPPDVIDRFPDQLSGGQKQRVNIARALCSNPRLLVADEIVSGLDVSVQAQILELLKALREEAAISLLLISHDLAVVRHICDRTVVMFRGEIVEQGPVEEVFGNPRHDYTRALVAAAQGGASLRKTMSQSQ
ncbi:ABC transporter ATP-binding protein [Stappia sp. P2PMeth1]|uniref:dipeptide ABC transporter ATP-binding protein n=1 Tax=Stappia sp. P2PMeth1 TaxID=2003586 RepID=UPI001644AF48|nr:ABC transporter ATP-binding protein [Stappia sp. P2PMeth1]